MEIVVTGYAGLGGSIAVYNDTVYREKLLSRYPKSFFAVFENIRQSGDQSILHAGAEGSAYAADEHGTECDQTGTETAKGVLAEEKLAETASRLDAMYAAAHEAGRAADGSAGGVLAALWEVLKANHKGGMYAQCSIPIMQQTIELCEMFELNPYRLHAPGCRVWLSDDTGALMQAAAAAGMPFGVIGYTSKGVAIRRTDTESGSSLRRPEADEISKLMTSGY